MAERGGRGEQASAPSRGSLSLVDNKCPRYNARIVAITRVIGSGSTSRHIRRPIIIIILLCDEFRRRKRGWRGAPPRSRVGKVSP